GVVTKQLQVVKKAVEAGADINTPDWLSCFHIPEWSLAKAASKNANGSPLHFAALTNNLEAAGYLLQRGATLHNTGLANWALNMCSCHWVDETYYADQDYVALPLHTAVCHGSLQVAKLFLEHGASVHLHGINRYSAEAAEKQNLPIKSDQSLLINTALTKTHNTAVIAKLVEFGAMEAWNQYSHLWLYRSIRNCMYDNVLAVLKAGLHALDP
ncbi:hypothetical protein B0T09DRAFT_239099, partial [Sordaria sp. MPI-SDFR-AT-0083]